MTFEDPRRFISKRRFKRSQLAENTPQATNRAKRIVLTGGPGSGKSTAASFLAREFVDELWVLPESATLLYGGGFPRSSSDLGEQISQRAIFAVQRSLEDASNLRHPGRVQLCDRSTIDGAAYWPDGADDFFRAMGTTKQQEIQRYDAVIFLHTAALLPAGYERDLNIRIEDNDQAIELDQKMQELYSEHPNIIHIQGSDSFLDKITAVRQAVADIIHDDTRNHSLKGNLFATHTPTLIGINGDVCETTQAVAPISSLMGLASVGHVLPVED